VGTRNSAKCALLAAVVLGCGRSGDPGQSEDHAALFAGDWYGTLTYVYRQNGAPYGTSTAVVEQPIMVTGKNALLMQHFCFAADPGVGANVTSATEFAVSPHQCSVNLPIGCPYSVSVESGSGRLSGTTLALAFHGTLTQPAGPSCSLLTLEFDITTSMTHAVPPVLKPETPQAVKVEKGEGRGRYELSWTVFDATLAVEVQAQIAGGDWNDAFPAFSSPNVVALDLDGVPDRTPVAFRVRTHTREGVSDWSTPASNDSGFDGPVLLDVDESTEVIRFRWQPRQDVVSMVIERNDSLEAPVWNVLTILTPPGSSYDDVQAVENHQYAYRFHWVDATTDSFRAGLSPRALPLHAPVGLTAVASPGRVDLSWTNRSQVATEVVVLRAGGLVDWSGNASEVARLPASATSFSDVGLAVDMYTYSVEASLPGEAISTGPLVPVVTPPPASSGMWSVSFVDLPAAREAALDADGGVLTFAGTMAASDSPPWLPYAPDGGAPFEFPSFVLDAELHPHLVYLRYTGPGPVTSAVIHDWFDGTAWQSEEMGRLDVLSYAWALDPSDHPVVLFTSDGTSAALRVLRWSGSAYVSENPGIALSGSPNLGAMLIAASPEGVIHVLAQDYTAVSTVHSWRGASWSSEPVPLAASVLLSRVTASTGDVVSLTTQNGRTANFQVLDRGSAGWGSPVDIGTSLGFGGLNERMTTTLAGSSPVLALNLPLSGVHIARRSDGWVPRQLTGPANLMGVGYDATSHLYVIVQGGYLSSGGYRAAVFREQ
jgi:hypothetical protein